MADSPENTTYDTGGASSAPVQIPTVGEILRTQNKIASAPASTPTTPATNEPTIAGLGAYQPVNTDVTDFLNTIQSGKSGFKINTPIGQASPQKISPDPAGYSPFVVPGPYTNPDSGVVPTSPAIQQMPYAGGGQMNVDTAHPGTLNKSVRANLNPLSTENAMILGPLSQGMFQVDHIIPLWAGGADTIANKQIIANPVHDAKTKIQSVAQTLLDHGEISLDQARVMALTWQNRSANTIPASTDGYGEIPLDTAKAIAKEWADADAGKSNPSISDVVKGIPEAALNLGKGTLPEWARQFLVGAASGLTAGGIPLQSAPGATVYDKLSGLVGEGVGMYVGIAALGGLSEMAGAALGFGKAAEGANAIRLALDDTIGGASIFDPLEEGVASTAKIASSPKTILNTIRNNMASDVVGRALKNAALFGAYGQIGQTISDFTQPQKNAIGAHISRLGEDLALGGLVGAVPASWKGAGIVGMGAFTIASLSGAGPQQAAANAVAMAALHKMGGFGQTPEDVAAQQAQNNVAVDEAATKGSLTVLHSLVGDNMGLTAINPAAPAPHYDPAMVDAWKQAAQAKIDYMDSEGQLKPFTGAGGPPSDKAILEKNLNIASDWLKSRELPDRDNTYTTALSKFARYIDGKKEVNNSLAPKALPEFVKAVDSSNSDLLFPKTPPEQNMVNGRWEIAPDQNAPADDGHPSLNGLVGDIRLTGQGANTTNEQQLQNFIKQLRSGDASPYVIFANQPELAPYFREVNRSITPEMIKNGDHPVDPENYVSVWGIVKDPNTGVKTIVPTGVKVPTQERIGVVNRDEAGARTVAGNKYAFNNDPEIVNGKYGEENPNFNNKTIATAMRTKGSPLMVARVKAFLGQDLRSTNPYMIATISPNEWNLTSSVWDTLGPPENLSTYEENIARAVAERGRTNIQPLLLKAADQLSELGHTAKTVASSQVFTGANERPQAALVELDSKAEAILSTATTPTEVQTNFAKELGIYLTPEEAHEIENNKASMTAGDLKGVLKTAISEGRTSPLTAASNEVYLKPLENSKVFQNSGSGLIHDKMPILSKASAGDARAAKISGASGKSLLEQAPINPPGPTEAATTPEYQKSLENLKAVGYGKGGEFTPQGLDTYVDAGLKAIKEANLSPEETKKLGDEFLGLLNPEDLHSRNTSWNSEDAFNKGQTSAEAAFDQGNTNPNFDPQFVDEQRQKIIDATGATGITKIPVPSEVRMKAVPEMVKKDVEPYFKAIDQGKTSDPTTYVRGHDQAFDEMARATWGDNYQNNYGLMQLLSDRSALGKATYGSERMTSKGVKPALMATETPEGKQIGQPKDVVAAAAGGPKAVSEAYAKRNATYKGATEGNLPAEYAEAGLHEVNPDQLSEENIQDLTQYEAELQKGLLDEEERGPDPVLSPKRGVEDATSQIFNLIERYNTAIDNGAIRGTKVSLKNFNTIKSSILSDIQKEGGAALSAQKVQTKIEELNKQDEDLAKVGGSKAIAYAKKVKASNDALREKLMAQVQKYQGGGGPGFSPDSPATTFANLGSNMNVLNPGGGQTMTTGLPYTLGAPGSSPSQNISQYLTGTSVVQKPQTPQTPITLNPTDTSGAQKTLNNTQTTLSNISNLVSKKAKDLEASNSDMFANIFKQKPTIFKQSTTPNMGKLNTGSGIQNPAIEGIDMSSYSTDPKHNEKILNIKTNIPSISGPQDIQNYISKVAPKSPVTGQMIWDAAQTDKVPVDLMVALAQEESMFGTTGKAVRTKNVGNVGNTTPGGSRVYKDWASGVKSMANMLAQNQIGRTEPAPISDPSSYTAYKPGEELAIR